MLAPSRQPTTSSRRSKPAPRPSRCSTPGSARCRPSDYREFVLPHSATIFEALKATGVPMIHFGTGTSTILPELRRGRRRRDRRRLAHAARRGLEAARRDRAIQGNLDPTLLLAPRRSHVRARPRTSCDARPGGPGTSSTSVTASCPRRRSSTCRCSPGSCTGSAPTDGCSRGRRRRVHRRRRRRDRRRTCRADAGARHPPPRTDAARARGQLPPRRGDPLRARRWRARRGRAGRDAGAEAGRARAVPRARTGRRDRPDRVPAHRVRSCRWPAARISARHAARPAADARSGRRPDDALPRGARPRRPRLRRPGGAGRRRRRIGRRLHHPPLRRGVHATDRPAAAGRHPRRRRRSPVPARALSPAGGRRRRRRQRARRAGRRAPLPRMATAPFAACAAAWASCPRR